MVLTVSSSSVPVPVVCHYRRRAVPGFLEAGRQGCLADFPEPAVS
jgi:hypothetical protein